MARTKAFTVIEMLVNVLILAVVLVLLLPAIAMSRRADRRMQNNDRVHEIVARCIQFTDGNSGKYPGLGVDRHYYTTPGTEWHTVNRRFWILIMAKFLTPDRLISPFDTDKTATNIPIESFRKNRRPHHTGLTPANFSYALRYIKEGQGRQWEWEATLNSRAATVFDRNVPAGSQPDAFFGPEARSIHSYRRWCGSVGYNDNHVVFEPNNVLGKQTQYGNVVNPAGTDDLFADEPGGMDGYNAYGVYN